LYCEKADVAAASFLGYYAPDPRRDTPAVLGEIAPPVLVVAGSKDTVVADLPERVGPMADGKRLSFAAVDGATHFFIDLHAEDVADLIEEFLAYAAGAVERRRAGRAAALPAANPDPIGTVHN
ncbi:MAG: alpha/beta hydrolase, partial [Rhodospirillaceae bacterium]